MRKQITARSLILWSAFLLHASTLAQTPENSKETYDQIVAQDEAHSACLAIKINCDHRSNDSCTKISCNTGSMFFGGNTSERNALAANLKANFKAGDLTAAFYWGYLNWIEGERITDTKTELMRNYQSEKFKEAYSGFSSASEGGVAAASWNIAVMYEQGHGLTRSKLAAAEWYAKASRQYLKEGEREKALAALEHIEEIDPKHTEAIKLRAILYQTSKRK